MKTQTILFLLMFFSSYLFSQNTVAISYGGNIVFENSFATDSVLLRGVNSNVEYFKKIKGTVFSLFVSAGYFSYYSPEQGVAIRQYPLRAGIHFDLDESFLIGFNYGYLSGASELSGSIRTHAFDLPFISSSVDVGMTAGIRTNGEGQFLTPMLILKRNF